MPIVNTGKLSPLEEESQGSCSGGEMMERNRKPNEDQSGTSVFTTLGTLVLTARPYESASRSTDTHTNTTSSERSAVDANGASLKGEIFQIVNKDSLLTMQEQMEKLWSERIPMCVEVKGQSISPSNNDSVLLEQWLIQVLPRRSHTPPIPPSLLTHAVQSFLHFSQIRSWIVSHRGCLPFELTYRVCAPGEDTSDHFSPHTPKLHTFPSSPLSPLSVLQVSVYHLPRLQHIPALLMPCQSVTEKFCNLSLSKSSDRLRDLSVQKSTEDLKQGSLISKSAERLKDVSVLKSVRHLNENPALFSKSADCLKDLCVVSNSAEQLKSVSLSKSAERFKDISSSCSVSTSRRITPLHLVRHPHNSPHNTSPHTSHTPYSDYITPHKTHLSTLHAAPQETFPFSPPQPSPMSPKLLAGLGEPLQYHSLLDRTALESESDHDNRSILGGRDELLEISDCYSKCHGQNSCQNCRTGDNLCAGSFCFNSACVRERKVGGRWGGGAEGGEKVKKRRDGVKPGAVRSPAASSPVPFRFLSETQRKHNSSTVRRSSAINIKGMHPTRTLRSNSAPAIMPSLSLLGTFEESVLNGRLEPCGFVEGFTAELGASGSFCPRHITFPVTAAFFNLSDSGTSPYLGVIDLSTTGRRGYHIAKKGTVQLTLFNPNGTVIKIFVVTYDFSDMPPNSQTFLRQKIISHSPPPSRPHILTTSLHSPPLLHYLIHLRFLCSKSGRVYLHKDIRLIFACRAPDIEPDFSRVTLITVMEAPPSPKYGPLDGQSEKSKLAGTRM